MFSRTIVIVLSFVVAGVQASRGAWTEVAGLVALGSGLVLLRLARGRPILKSLAWLAFSVTAVSMVLVFLRGR